MFCWVPDGWLNLVTFETYLPLAKMMTMENIEILGLAWNCIVRFAPFFVLLPRAKKGVNLVRLARTFQ